MYIVFLYYMIWLNLENYQLSAINCHQWIIQTTNGSKVLDCAAAAGCGEWMPHPSSAWDPEFITGTVTWLYLMPGNGTALFIFILLNIVFIYIIYIIYNRCLDNVMICVMPDNITIPKKHIFDCTCNVLYAAWVHQL